MPKILIVEDEINLRIILKKMFKKKLFEVDVAPDAQTAITKLEQQSFDVALMDINLPDKSGLEILKQFKEKKKNVRFIIMTAQDTMNNAVEAMKLGAFDYISKPFELVEMESLVEQAIEAKKSDKQIKKAGKDLFDEKQFESEIIGQSKGIKDIFKIIGRVANSQVSVLIIGESGTGKELIARSIHANGSRAHAPFLAVNCAAIPKDLLESELFGYVRGAFTGAQEDRMGFFEKADGGTIFLDEIGDMPLVLQAKLLRVLQEREVQRLGSDTPRKIDVRVVSATNHNLEKRVAEKSFREDLFFRLNVIPIKVPSLRERKEDIPLLASYFLKRLAVETQDEEKKCTPGAIKLLENYPWPGNIRELENVLKRAAILSSQISLDVIDFAPFLGANSHANTFKDFEKMRFEELVETKISQFLDRFDQLDIEDLYKTIVNMVERPLIKLVMQKLNNNQIKTSKVLGINRNTLRKKIKELKVALKEEE